MRAFIFTSLALLMGGPALAGSIETIVAAPDKGNSIVRIVCDTCPAPKSKEEISGYRVPSLPAGTQHVEVREIDGRKTLVRTEAWMGGSPVTYVSSSLLWLDDKGTAIANSDRENGDGIDLSAQTSAVGSTGQQDVLAASSRSIAEPPALDASAFQLRLN
jgi:hypothetical protein